MNRRYLIYFILFFQSINLLKINGQTLKLDDCIRKALLVNATEENLALIQKENRIKDAIATTQNLPKISFGAQATYQTQVTSINLPFPGIEVPSPTKDQYKMGLDLNQVLYDGGVSSKMKKANATMAQMDSYQVRVDQLAMEEKITQLYFSITMLDNQLQLLSSTEKQLTSKRQRILNQINDGIASKGDLLQLNAVILEVNNKQKEAIHARLSFIKALGTFMGEELNENVKTSEEEPILGVSESGTRPELLLLQSKKEMIQAQLVLNDTKYTPKISLFANGAYGRPGLNFLSNTFDFYGMGGIQLKVPLDHFIFGNKSKDSELAAIQTQRLNNSSQTVETYFQSLITQKKEEIQKLADIIKNDESLLDIRKEQTQLAEIKYQEGIMTISDFTDAIENELQTRLAFIQHKIQSDLAIHQLRLLYGKI